MSNNDSSSVSLDHQGLEVLSTDECWHLLRESPLGRVAFVDAGEPMVFPVNHAVVGHRVTFRTAHGALLHEAFMDSPVAYEVDGYDAADRSGWSVLVRGQASLADDDIDAEGLGLEPWADAVDRDDVVTILVEEITGRRIVRSSS